VASADPSHRKISLFLTGESSVSFAAGWESKQEILKSNPAVGFPSLFRWKKAFNLG
jgi:hypothetical protein